MADLNVRQYQLWWEQLIERSFDPSIANMVTSDRILRPQEVALTALALPPADINISRNPTPSSWAEVFRNAGPVLEALENIYRRAQQESFNVFPRPQELFNAYFQTPLTATDPSKPWQRVRVVIIGQDPYPQYDQILNRPRAMGLAFSCPGNTPNRSLENIFKEIKSDYPQFDMRRSYDLSDWARQGVFLYNYSLVVKENSPSDKETQHICSGLFRLTIEAIVRHNPQCKWLLWGRFAQTETKKYLKKVSEKNIFQAAHPSPLSSKGFFGCGHFRKVNEQLIAENQEPIQW